MTALYRLVYASKNLLGGAEPEAQAAVAEILAASRRNNVRAGVTGALMFNGGAFAQVLEGPQAGVEETFERIQRDPRHGDVTVLECRPVNDRTFSDWSMAFVGQSAKGQAVWNGLAAESGFDLRRLDGDAVFAMLHGLVLEEEGVAASLQAALSGATPVAGDGPPPRVLDAARLREELAQRPSYAAAASGPEAHAMAGADSTAVAILKAALSEERSRTSALRAELDGMRIRMAETQRGLDILERQRELWTQYARALTESLSGERTPSEGGAVAPARGELATVGRSRAVA